MRKTKIWDKEYELSLEDTEYTESRWFINDNWEKTSFSWHFTPFEISIKESNYMKSSYLSWDDVRKQCEGTLKMNWVQVFECWNRTYDRVYKEIQQFIDKLELIDMDEFINDKWKGKIIGYKEQLFVIDYNIVDQGCIIIKPKDWIRKPFLWELWDMEEYPEKFELKESIKLCITSDIDWFINEELYKCTCWLNQACSNCNIK